MSHPGIITKYRSFLPLDLSVKPVTLFEGNTPLIPLNNLKRHLNTSSDIYAKFEGMNPSGSFKDRGMTVAVSQAVHEGARAIICASTGNTSASAAAYAASAGIKCFVIIPSGKIAMGKLAQAMIHNACTIQITGNFDDGMAIVKSLAKNLPIALVNSVNPYRLQGQKTIAFEVIDTLRFVPDYHVMPVGNAGNISAHHMGYREYFEQGFVSSVPKLVGYQAEGAAPFVRGAFIQEPETVATAIRIGTPQSWDKAQDAVKKTHGWFRAVSDKAILEAQELLARVEGIFCEPASAASIAGLIQDMSANRFASGTIVCTLTGHGLKDPNIAIDRMSGRTHSVAADLQSIESFIKTRLV